MTNCKLEPISPETPKDTLVLVWGTDGFSVASYDSSMARWYAENDGELASNRDGDLFEPNPTHWMALPETPEPKTSIKR